jgi:hypothetical protein
MNSTAGVAFPGSLGIRAKLPVSGPGKSRLALLECMDLRLHARVRALARERDRLAKLLEEADVALAKAGVTCQAGNIRERINACHAFQKVAVYTL